MEIYFMLATITIPPKIFVYYCVSKDIQCILLLDFKKNDRSITIFCLFQTSNLEAKSTQLRGVRANIQNQFGLVPVSMTFPSTSLLWKNKNLT